MDHTVKRCVMAPGWVVSGGPRPRSGNGRLLCDCEVVPVWAGLVTHIGQAPPDHYVTSNAAVTCARWAGWLCPMCAGALMRQQRTAFADKLTVLEWDACLIQRVVRICGGGPFVHMIGGGPFRSNVLGNPPGCDLLRRGGGLPGYDLRQLTVLQGVPMTTAW